ncbi:Fur family transcriptional regulator [Jiangella mangrovi]|uniref:Fur family ferric uptake transcriptional regulator n=1 Tax=Jiangella mangrovi TaxID=1524084 RepID=A0A7W9LM22_9ACTN|nr:Fur family transcriptional regulator [Jiangella mangrovi]MBB5788818.1 Fur family ferric uptake transcriptional regulator [Jiangella mangrovi]
MPTPPGSSPAVSHVVQPHTHGHQDYERHARTALRGFGLRSTPQRLAIIKALSEAHDAGHADGGAHLTVPEIHDALDAAGMHIELSTIYRTVATLVEHGVLHAIAYVDRPASYGLAGIAHHHAVCVRCGTVYEISSTALADAMRAIEDVTGFLPDDLRVTAHGTCVDCRNQPAAAGED